MIPFLFVFNCKMVAMIMSSLHTSVISTLVLARSNQLHTCTCRILMEYYEGATHILQFLSRVELEIAHPLRNK